jgi:glycosyltransferase involved in cell wall biosynthesis
MKPELSILHIGNPANVAVEIRDEQRRLGFESNVLQHYRSSAIYNLREDYRFYDGPGMLRRLGYRMTLLDLIKRADVIHAHGGFWPKIIAHYIARSKKKFILHYHGRSQANSPIRRNEKHAGGVILSTPNLLPLYEGGVYIPNPIDASSIRPSSSRRAGDERGFRGWSWRIVHAHSLHEDLEAVKGTETIRNAVQKLNTQYVEVFGMEHEAAKEIYRSADIAVDQMRIGWYGMFALECMAIGLPVVGYKVDYGYENPVVGATDSTLTEVLSELMENVRWREAVKRAQFNHVMTEHSPRRVVPLIHKIYDEA